MKILIIDDEKSYAENLRLTLEEQIPEELEVIHHDDFETAFERVRTVSPDAVVLDIFKGSHDDDRGTDIGEQIWKKHFCPFIIYTARPQEEHEELAMRSPFVRLCVKRIGGDIAVADELRSFSDHIRTVNRVRDDMLDTLWNSLKHVANVIWKATDNAEERLELVERVTRRRVAASLDFAANDATGLRAWEQFIYPPIHRNDLLTGDVLLDLNASSMQPTSYRIVLTPSCDLVTARGDAIEEALVARCVPFDKFTVAAGLSATPKANKLMSRLTPDQVAGYIPFPALPSILPLMAANLKHLELVPLEAIDPYPSEASHGITQDPTPSTHRFRRVASVDSPFRERIAWAYVQVSGRPGMPDIAIGKFAEDIEKALSLQGGGN